MNKNGERWKTEGGIQFRRSRCAHSAPFPPHRLGLTLIELLIAIAIIATLSALFLGASRAAMESARSARTKTTISKLHTLIMEHWASYETRRVDIRPDLQNEINSMPEATREQQQVKAAVVHDCRLLALRELMKYEMPDRWSDFVDLNADPPLLIPRFLSSAPTISKTYLRRFIRAMDAAKGDADKIANVEMHKSAECLYLTIMLMTGDGEARTIFTAQDIGDVDEDGLPEFLDGWGNPIGWSRWPAGFAARSQLLSGDTIGDHDPFDPFGRNLTTAVPNDSSSPDLNQVYSNQPSEPFNLASVRPFAQALRLRDFGSGSVNPGYRLLPLIYSAGPDGVWDIDSSGGLNVTNDLFLNPYAPSPDSPSPLSFPPGEPSYAFGQPWDVNEDGDDNSIDNIHNHLQDNR